MDLSYASDESVRRAAEAVQEIYASFGRSREELNANARKKGFEGKFSAEGNLKFDPKELNTKLQALKARTECKDCGKKGHWAGDKECESPSELTLKLRKKRQEARQGRSTSSSSSRQPAPRLRRSGSPCCAR